jgi:hypothetical protein
MFFLCLLVEMGLSLRKSHVKLVFLNFLLLINENNKWCAEIDFCHWKMKENEDADGRIEK